MGASRRKGDIFFLKEGFRPHEEESYKLMERAKGRSVPATPLPAVGASEKFDKLIKA